MTTTLSIERQNEIIEATINFVKTELATAESGHDFLHIQRVYKNALLINSTEKANHLIVSLAALLHDIADSKFHDGDEDIGPRKAREFLLTQDGIDTAIVNEIELIIKNMSYKASLGEVTYTSHELKVVQDADRLDAIGAMGIARCFTYGGYKNRRLYDPDIQPNLNMSKEEYKNSNGPTINHFYEKLLLLKDKMNTEQGKVIAEGRHQAMLDFLEQFHAEVDGTR